MLHLSCLTTQEICSTISENLFHFWNIAVMVTGLCVPSKTQKQNADVTDAKVRVVRTGEKKKSLKITG